MKARVGIVATTLLAATFTMSSPAQAQELTGDVRYACEAILCLAAPSRPGECNTAIKKYFSISAKKFKDTIKKRKNFLALCPKTDIDLDKIVAESTPDQPENPPLPKPKPGEMER